MVSCVVPPVVSSKQKGTTCLSNNPNLANCRLQVVIGIIELDLGHSQQAHSYRQGPCKICLLTLLRIFWDAEAMFSLLLLPKRGCVEEAHSLDPLPSVIRAVRSVPPPETARRCSASCQARRAASAVRSRARWAALGRSDVESRWRRLCDVSGFVDKDAHMEFKMKGLFTQTQHWRLQKEAPSQNVAYHGK